MFAITIPFKRKYGNQKRKRKIGDMGKKINDLFIEKINNINTKNKS